MGHIFNTIASILVILLASCSKPEYRFVDGIGYQINSLPMEMLDAQELEMCIKIDSLSIYGIEINERGEKVLLVDKKDFKKLGVPISFFKDMRMQVKHLKKMMCLCLKCPSSWAKTASTSSALNCLSKVS